MNDCLIRGGSDRTSAGNRRSVAGNGRWLAILLAVFFLATQPVRGQDNELPVVTVAGDDVSVTEGTDATFTLTRTATDISSGLTVSVDVTQDGDVIEGSAPAEVTFGASASEASLTVATDDDSVDEFDGAVHAQIAEDADGDYLVGASASATVRVLDDDLPLVTVAADDESVEEGDDVTFTLTRRAADVSSTLTAEVAVLVRDDGAVVFNRVEVRQVTFDANATTATLTVATTDDDLDEPEGQVRAVLFQSLDYQVVPLLTANVGVRDNDPPSVTIAAAAGSVTEGDNAVFIVTRTAGDLAPPLTVRLSVTEEGDVLSGTAPTEARFTAGSSTATLRVATRDDTSEEADGRIRVTLAEHTGYRVAAPTTASVAVLDDDRPAVSIAATSSSVDEPDSPTVHTAGFVVTRTGDRSQPLSVNVRAVFTTTDRGKTTTLKTLTNTLRIPAEAPGVQSSQAVWPISIHDDDVWIQDHRVTMSIDDSDDYQTSPDTNSAAVRIVDNDASQKQNVYFDFATISLVGERIFLSRRGTEGAGPITVPLRRRLVGGGDSAGLPALTVNLDFLDLDAQRGHHAYVTSTFADALPSTVEFGAGKTTTDVTLRIAEDRIQEKRATFRISLRPGSGYTVTGDVAAAVIILDDDHYEHWFKVEPARESVREGEAVVFTFTRFAVAAPANKADACRRSVADLPRIAPALLSPNTVNLSWVQQGDYLSGALRGSPYGVTLGAGAVRKRLTWWTANDNIDEADGSIEGSLIERRLPDNNEAANWTYVTCLAAPASAGLITIRDDDEVTGVTLSVSPDDVREGAGATRLTVRAALEGAVLDTATDVAVAIHPTASPPATLPQATIADFSEARIAATVRIPARRRSATATLTFTPVDDSLVEGPELLPVAGSTTATFPGTETALPVAGTILTIQDNESPPSVALTVNPSEITEDGGAQTVAVTATLAGRSRLVNAVALPVAVADGSATGADYAATGVTVTIPANTASGTATLTVTPVDDNRLEGSETVQFTSDGGPYLNWNLAVTSATLTITDDDTPKQALTLQRPATAGFYHAGDVITVAYTVLNSGNVASAAPVVVHDTKFGQTTCSAAALAVAPETDTGNTAAHRCAATTTYTVTDADVTAGEIVSTAYAAAGTVQSEPVQATIARLEPPTLRFDPASADVQEAAGKVEFTVALGGTTPAQTTTVKWSTLDWPGAGQRAVAGEDYTASSGTLTFANGLTEQRIRVPVSDDYLDEADERFVVTLSEPTWPTVLDLEPVSTSFPDVRGATALIGDDDRQAILETANEDAVEGDGFAEFWVMLEPTGRNARVDWATEEITGAAKKATAGSDFTAAQGTLTFAPSARFQEQYVRIAILDDAMVEPTERFRVVFSNPYHARIQTGGASRRGRIYDNDQAGVVVRPDELEVPEGGSATYTVKLTTQPAADVTVTATVPSGTDVTVGDGTVLTQALTFTSATWNTSRTVTVHAAADDDTADDKVKLTHAANGEGYGSVAVPEVTVTVVDPPIISISNASAREDAGTLAFPASLSHSRNETVAVQWATEDSTAIAGADYEAGSGTLTFAAGERQATFGVTILDDRLVEPDETFTVTLSGTRNGRLSGGGATLAVRGGITDDDEIPLLAVEAVESRLDEADGYAEFEVALDVSSPTEITVDWATEDGTATAGADYEAGSGTLTFATGEQRHTVVVTFLDDNRDEPDTEEFHVVLTDPRFAAFDPGKDRTTQTIADNEETPRLTVADKSLREVFADMSLRGDPGHAERAGGGGAVRHRGRYGEIRQGQGLPARERHAALCAGGNPQGDQRTGPQRHHRRRRRDVCGQTVQRPERGAGYRSRQTGRPGNHRGRRRSRGDGGTDRAAGDRRGG